MLFFPRSLSPPMSPFHSFIRHARTLAASRQKRVIRARQGQSSGLQGKQPYQFDNLDKLGDTLFVHCRETCGELHLEFMKTIREARLRLDEDLRAAHARLETDLRELQHIYLEDYELRKLGVGKKREETLGVGDVAADANYMLRLAGKSNVRGALERIVYQGKLLDKISYSSNIQDGLDWLALSDEFAIALEEEVQARGLQPGDVRRRVADLYSLVCSRTHANESTIIVRATQYCPNDQAALVTFLKVQSRWPYALGWREDESGEEVY